MKIDGSRILVTGGSSGIGKETAKALAARGAHVAICGRDVPKLERAAADTSSLAIRADVADEADVTALVDRAVRELGGLDVLVNNAGWGNFAPLVDLSRADLMAVWETNVLGAMLVAREAARHFIRTKTRGSIVNIASTAGLRGFAGGTAYVATKFALRGMTECWRAELRTHDIRVMLVNPSEVQTEFFTASGRPRELSERKLRPAEIAHAIVAMLEMDDRGFIPELSVWATNPD